MEKSKWKSPSKESLKEAYNNRGKYIDTNNRKYIFSQKGSSLLWKVEDKSHKVRLLPVHPDDNINFYGMTVHIHTNVGVNGDQYLCLKKMKNLDCPICKHQAELWETEPEMAKDLYPQSRYLVWVVDLSVELNKQRATIWSCPRTAMDDLLGVSYKKATDEILNLADVDDGIAVYFDREKTQGTTFSKYKNFQLDEGPSPVKEEWLKGIISFKEAIEYPTYEEVKNAFLGLHEETTTEKETVETTKEDVTHKVETTDADEDVDTMDRDELEILAINLLSEDYEESEIEEMGTKKLRRLVKEVIENKTDPHVEDTKEDPREVLKQKLRDRVK